MPLLRRLRRHHSVRQFRAAARQRYNEAIRLASGDDRLGAIYLSGYTAEMLLKAAYFRLAGWAPNQPIVLQDIRNARAHAILVRGLAWAGNNLHDLVSWRNLLMVERAARGPAYGYGLRRTLTAQVDRLQVNWGPELRYYTNRPSRTEMRVSLAAAQWLLLHFRAL